MRWAMMMLFTSAALFAAESAPADPAPADPAPKGKVVSGKAALELKIMFETVVPLEGACSYKGFVKEGTGLVRTAEAEYPVFVPGRTYLSAKGPCSVGVGPTTVSGEVDVKGRLQASGQVKLSSIEGKVVASDPDNGDSYLIITMEN